MSSKMWRFVLVAGLVAPLTVGASTVTFGSDTTFVAYQNTTPFTKEFGGNVRWGSGTASGDWEYAVVNGSDVPIGAVGQTAWGNANYHDVTFSFDGTNSATLSLVGIGSLTRTVTTSGPNALFLRVRDSSGESGFSKLGDICIDLVSSGGGCDYSYSYLAGDPDAEYWGVLDDRLRFGFTAYADAELLGPRTAGSNPMYQFKVGTIPSVPLPAAAWLLLSGLGGLGLLSRRKAA